MDSSLVFGVVVCVGAFLAIAIVAAVVNHQREGRRREALQYWAVRNGWHYTPRPEVEWWRRMPGRHRRGVVLALTGLINGRQVSIAEYQYTTTTGTSDASTTTTHHYVLYVARLRRQWPAVAVQHRGAVSRFGRALFGDRATAIGYEPFDSAYRISADRPETARAIFGRGLIDEHVAGRLPEWSLYGDELMTYETGRIDDPEAIPARCASLVRVADLIESQD